jgi:hypothetical protein
MAKYPESEKLRSPDVGILRQFMEWLTEERDKPIELYFWESPDDNHPSICFDKPEDLIMEYLGIDQKKLEHERRAMVEEMRS